MRVAPLVVLVACAHPPPPPPAAPPVVAPPIELAIADDTGAERVVKWTEKLAIPHGSEDAGAFAYAQRYTLLHHGTSTIGWLEAGARVGVISMTRDRAEVELFA